ncbi:hypothetical protein ACGFNU_21200 [Spirillospora sp. NPDC048911]|uniref:hypothetical protein n=1 Tax=Spirillospora sp. NPDC048911 TaxID=3364527 RepID=UPI00371338EC
MRFRGFGLEPAIIAYVINGGVALLVAFGLPASQGQVEAVTVITTAIAAAVTAVMTRPLVVSTLTGSLATVMAALAAFRIDFNAEQIGQSVAFVSLVLALLLRQNVSPAPAVTARPPQA